MANSTPDYGRRNLQMRIAAGAALMLVGVGRTGMVRYAWTGEISRAMLEKFVTPLLRQTQ